MYRVPHSTSMQNVHCSLLKEFLSDVCLAAQTHKHLVWWCWADTKNLKHQVACIYIGHHTIKHCRSPQGPSLHATDTVLTLVWCSMCSDVFQGRAQRWSLVRDSAGISSTYQPYKFVIVQIYVQCDSATTTTSRSFFFLLPPPPWRW